MTIKNRLYASACLAGPLVDAGLGPTDADAFHALLSGTLDDLVAYADDLPQGRAVSLLSLVVTILARHGDYLEKLSAALQWETRKVAYDEDCASWKTAEADCGVAWREMPMTRGQRFLIADTAALLEIEIPEGMDRGTAADWLDANDANVVLRLGWNAK